MYVHSINPNDTRHAEARNFYHIYLPQRTILADFYSLLPEESYDYRMVDRADTPRQSFLHILATHRQYLDGIKNGALTFAEPEAPSDVTKPGLLAAMDRIEQETWEHLSSAAFDPDAAVEASWGRMRAGDAI